MEFVIQLLSRDLTRDSRRFTHARFSNFKRRSSRYAGSS